MVALGLITPASLCIIDRPVIFITVVIVKVNIVKSTTMK